MSKVTKIIGEKCHVKSQMSEAKMTRLCQKCQKRQMTKITKDKT